MGPYNVEDNMTHSDNVNSFTKLGNLIFLDIMGAGYSRLTDDPLSSFILYAEEVATTVKYILNSKCSGSDWS